MVKFKVIDVEFKVDVMVVRNVDKYLDGFKMNCWEIKLVKVLWGQFEWFVVDFMGWLEVMQVDGVRFFCYIVWWE